MALRPTPWHLFPMLMPLLLSLPLSSPPPPSGSVVPLPPTEGMTLARWSPDARGVVLCREDGVYLAAEDAPLIPLWTGEPCFDLAFDAEGLVFAGGDGPFLWRFDGRDVVPIEGPPVGAVVSDGDTLVVAAEHAVQRIRGGEVLASAAVPGVGRMHPTRSGFLAVAEAEVVALDPALGITGRWTPGPDAHLRLVAGVGDFVVVADAQRRLRSLDAQARAVAEAVHAGGPIRPFSQENQILVGDQVRSVPGLELLGWQGTLGDHPVPGPGRTAWVGAREVVFGPPAADPLARGRGVMPVALVHSGDHLLVAAHERWVSIVNVGTGRVEHAVPTCVYNRDLAGRPGGPFWVLCDRELIRLGLDGRPVRYPLPAAKFSASLALDAQGRPHVLSHSGLHVLDPDTGTLTTRPEVKPPLGRFRLTFTPAGEVAVLTFQGLSVHHEGGKSRVIPTPSNTRHLRDALWVGDRLWTLHDTGLVARTWPGLDEVVRVPEVLATRLVALPGGDLVALGVEATRVRPTGEVVWSAPAGGEHFAFDPRRDVVWSVRVDGAIVRQSMADGAALRALPPTAPLRIESATWLADGSLVTIDGDRGLWSWSPTHTPGRRLTERRFSSAVVTGDGVLLITSSEALPFEPNAQGTPVLGTTPVWRMGSLGEVRSVAPAVGLGLWGHADLQVFSLRDGQVQSVLPGLPGLADPALSADGRRVAALDGERAPHVIEVGSKRWKLLGIRPSVPGRLGWQGDALLVTGEAGLVRWTPDGARWVVPGSFTDLAVHAQGVVLAGGRTLTFLDADLRPIGYAASDTPRLGPISPDGRWLATFNDESVVVWDLPTRTARARYTVWADGFWEIRRADGTHDQGRTTPSASYVIK